MARDDPHFRLRLPENLKTKVEIAAIENRRSITAEVIARLETSFEVSAGIVDIDARIERLTKAIEEQQELIKSLLIQERNEN